MSIFKQDLNQATDTVDYNPALGYAEAQLVAIADMGVEVNPDGKEAHKIGLLFAVEQEVKVGEKTYFKTYPEKVTASFYEKATLFKKFISPAGWDIPGNGEILPLLGKQVNLFFKQSPTNAKYVNIIDSMVEPTKKPFTFPEDGEILIPKFWKEKNGQQTGFEIITVNDTVL